MTPRERTLAVLLLGFMLLGAGGALGYLFVYTPYQEKKAASAKLQEEINDFQGKLDGVVAGRARVAEIKRQSLPSDENFAQAEYKKFLEQLLREAGISDYTIPDSEKPPARAPVTPELAPKKFAYTQLRFKIVAGGTNLWQVVDFLRAFYQTELLHQITYISIARTNKPTDPRNGLELRLTVDAIILDGAENRRTLLPPATPVVVPSAVAAVGGVPGMQLVARKPDLARKSVPANAPGRPTPVLSTRPRDYSYVAWKDIFYGVLPTYVPPPPPAFALDKLADVTLARDERPVEAKVKLSGEGVEGAKVTAAATGSLLPEGPLAVNPATLAVTIPGVASEYTADDATSTVTVVAVAGDGSATVKGSFKVTVGRRLFVPPPPGPDIASAIKMPIISGGSDGTRKAVVYDAANPYKFEIVADDKSVKVTRWALADVPKARPPRKELMPDPAYKYPTPDVLSFGDSFSSTKRTFKVLAVEEDGLILEERPFAQPDGAKGPWGGPGGGKGFGPPGGGRGPRQGPADPLAAVIGSPAAARPIPVFYRWTQGKSLKDLVRLSNDEATAIQKRVAAGGPVMVSAVSSGN